VSCRDDVEVVEKTVVLVVLGTSQEFLVVHDPEICSLNRVVGVEGIENPVLAAVISTSIYLHFISYTMTLASFSMIGLSQRRLSSCIVSWIWGGVPLDVGNIGCVVGGIISSIGRGVCWRISRKVGWSVGSGISWLHYFIFTSSLFNHRVEGTLATTLLSMALRSASGMRTCGGSTVSRTFVFDLSSGDADVGLETPDHCKIFKVIQSGKSSSQVGLRRVVDFESIALEVPEEVSRTQSVGTR
jgi:hypothetical protein